MPQMFPVQSSNVRSAGYDQDSQELTVAFRSGSTYVYSGVPVGVLEDLMNAASAGRYVNENIKNVYSEKKVG